MIQSEGMTCNEVLSKLGMQAVKKHPSDHAWMQRNIIKDGKVVFTGHCHEVWEWMRNSGYIA